MHPAESPPAYSASQQPQRPTVAVQLDPSAVGAGKERGNWKGLRITGYLQVILGITSVLLGLIAFVFKSFMFQIGNPIWSGIAFYIVTGILGIAAGGKRHTGLVVAYLTMSIIASVVACGLVIAHGIAVALERCPDWALLNAPYDWRCSSSPGSRTAINVLIAVFALAEMAAAIVGASLTCTSLCCGHSSTRTTHVVTYSAPHVVNYAVAPPQQYVQQPQFGNVMYPGQQVVTAPGQIQHQPQFQAQGQTKY